MMSTPMIGPAPTMRAAMTAARPTAPVPKTAMPAPAGTASEFITVPAPVCRPQPRGARSSSGSSRGTMTTLRLVARLWVANDDCPKKCPRTPLRSECIAAVEALEPEVRLVKALAIRGAPVPAGRAAAAGLVGQHDVIAAA